MSDNVVHAEIDSLTYGEFRQATRRVTIRIAALAVIAGEVAAILACSIFRASLWAALIIPAAALAISLLVSGVSTKNRYTRNRSALSNIRYTFDNRGFTVSNGRNTEKCRWNGIMRMDMDPKCIFIYPNRSSVNVIPRRCLAKGDGDKIMKMYQDALPKTGKK
ncbi:MAG: YcxB family protein [Oscillospiraceae bacterium]|nr:YcxB family protein [Oscillospiraceae bacterium]